VGFVGGMTDGFGGGTGLVGRCEMHVHMYMYMHCVGVGVDVDVDGYAGLTGLGRLGCGVVWKGNGENGENGRWMGGWVNRGGILPYAGRKG
jgi:hypothetical protein